VEGLAGLQDRRYGAVHHPNQTKSGIEEQIGATKAGASSLGEQEATGPFFGDEEAYSLACGEHLWRDLATERVERTQQQAMKTPVYSKPFEKVEASNQTCVGTSRAGSWLETESGLIH